MRKAKPLGGNFVSPKGGDGNVKRGQGGVLRVPLAEGGEKGVCLFRRRAALNQLAWGKRSRNSRSREYQQQRKMGGTNFFLEIIRRKG